jgi:hypothetical protein
MLRPKCVPHHKLWELLETNQSKTGELLTPNGKFGLEFWEQTSPE